MMKVYEVDKKAETF